MTASPREHKKAQTRARIADAAARLFAAHGYERVGVADVARAAEVSEKTVFNYFTTKEQLVLDRDDEERERVVELIRERDRRTTPAGAVRADALAIVEQFRTIPRRELRGHVGYLAHVSPAIHRLCLEMADRHATAFAHAIVRCDTADACTASRAKLYGIAIAWVYQTIIVESGRMTAAGCTPGQVADELAPVVDAVLDDVERLPVPVTRRRT